MYDFVIKMRINQMRKMYACIKLFHQIRVFLPANIYVFIQRNVLVFIAFLQHHYVVDEKKVLRNRQR